MTTACLTRLALVVLGMLLGASVATAADSFPWTDDSAAAVGEYLAIREVAEAPGPGSSGLAVLASSVKPAGAMEVSVGAAGSGLPLPALAAAFRDTWEQQLRWQDSTLRFQQRQTMSSPILRSYEPIILGPGSTPAPLTVNSPKPFKLPEPYGTTFAIAAPTVNLLKETRSLGDAFSSFARGLSVTSAGLSGISIGTDLVNVSRSNDPYHPWRLTGDIVHLATGVPGGRLADVGNAMRTEMIGQRNSMVIDKLAGTGAMRGILENRLDHPTRLSSQHLLRATTFSQYTDGFTRREVQMEFTQLRTETYGRFDYFHAVEPVQTTIVTRQFETIRTWQGWSSFGNSNLGSYGMWAPAINPTLGIPLQNYQMMTIWSVQAPRYYQTMGIRGYQMPNTQSYQAVGVRSYQTPIVPSLRRTK